MLFSALRHPRRGDPDAYEWDENKRMENREKHGIDFANMSRFDWDSAIFKPPWRHEEGKEWRQTAIGYIDDDTDDRRLYVAVFTERGKKNADHQPVPG